jgi:hypothetical protein
MLPAHGSKDGESNRNPPDRAPIDGSALGADAARELNGAIERSVECQALAARSATERARSRGPPLSSVNVCRIGSLVERSTRRVWLTGRDRLGLSEFAECAGKLRPGADAELAVCAGEVNLDSPWGDEQRLGDLAVGRPLGRQFCHSTLARRERLDATQGDPSRPCAAGGSEFCLGACGERHRAAERRQIQRLAQLVARVGAPVWRDGARLRGRCARWRVRAWQVRERPRRRRPRATRGPLGRPRRSPLCVGRR